jgi:RNA polymerase sigma factor (sigma-70 family)
VRVVPDQKEKLLGLLRRCTAGDDVACEWLCKECARIVRSYLLRLSYFRGKREAVDDVTQQVFVKLWKAGFKDFRGISDYQFRNYLRTTTNREAFTFISKDDPPPENSTLPGAPNMALAAITLERQLKACLPKDQEIFIMVAIKGKTYEEVAEVLGMKRATVALRYSRVREGIERALSGT